MSETKKKETKEVVETKSSLPADPLAAMAGVTGYEDVTSDELVIPYINLLQTNSEAVEENDSLKPGMMINSNTGEIFMPDEGAVVIPVFKQQLFVEQVPYDEGGGFISTHEPDSDFVKQALAASENGVYGLTCNDGKHELNQTFFIYCLMLDKEGKEAEGFAVVAFSSSKISAWKKWITAMMSVKNAPPMHTLRAVLRSRKDKKGNNTFHTFEIKPFTENWKTAEVGTRDGSQVSYDEDETKLLGAVADLYKMVNSGKAAAKFEDSGEKPVEGTKAPF